MKHSARRESWCCAQPRDGTRTVQLPPPVSEEKTLRSGGARDDTHPGWCDGEWRPVRPEGDAAPGGGSERCRWRLSADRRLPRRENAAMRWVSPKTRLCCNSTATL